MRDEIPDPLLGDDVSPSWDAVLKLLAAHAEQTPLAVVFDEFQYLCRDKPELPSVFQKFWDGPGREGKLFLVLCGPHISFMEEQVLAERAPLFGRRTAQLLIRPLSYLEAGLFHPSGSPDDKVALYGVFGGLPAYLTRWERTRTLRQNVVSAILRPGAPLYDEVSFLLRTELGQPHTYASVLAAIASGARRSGEIADRSGLRDVSVSRYLEVLQDLHLIARETPVTESQPHKSKRGRYTITDPFLRFWFRFVMPYQSLIEVGQGPRVYDSLIAPNLDSYLGSVFESVCCQFLRRSAGPDWELCKRVGRQWGDGPEIDILTENIDGSHYACECKWTRKAVGVGVLDKLREAAPPGRQSSPSRYPVRTRL